MKNIKLSASEIRSIEHFLSANPCLSGCAYPEMSTSKKSCEDCKLTQDKNSLLEKLSLLN